MNPSLEYSGPGPELDAYSLKENIIEEIRTLKTPKPSILLYPKKETIILP